MKQRNKRILKGVLRVGSLYLERFSPDLEEEGRGNAVLRSRSRVGSAFTHAPHRAVLASSGDWRSVYVFFPFGKMRLGELEEMLRAPRAWQQL